MNRADFIFNLMQRAVAMAAIVRSALDWSVGWSMNRTHWRGQPVLVRVQAGTRRVR